MPREAASRREELTPYKKVLLVVGGATVLVTITIAVIFVQTGAAGATLRTDSEAAFKLQTLGDDLAASVQDQREAIAEYLLSGDPGVLAAYRQALADETRTEERIEVDAEGLTDVTQALARVVAESSAWRANVADVAIAAFKTGSADAIDAAKQAVLQDDAATQMATSQLQLPIDAIAADFHDRSDALNGFRNGATAFGVAVELLAAVVSLWFVRRYGVTVARDTTRRVQLSAERLEIVASLRTLRMQPTPEATAALLAEALHRLPGIDIAGVLECTPAGLMALAIVGLPAFPIRSGEAVPEERARYLRERSDGGPWAEAWIPPAQPTAYEDAFAAAGIRSQAYAPIRSDGELIGLIAMATTDVEHARHLIEDLPAVVEFASMAESILAPALVTRRDREEKRGRIVAAIASAAFRTVFQPIVDLATGTAVGFEALTRFDDRSPPDLTFAEALECGMGIELELVTLKGALHEARQLAPGAWISLNVSPALLAERGLLAPMLADRPEAIVLEVTEHEAIGSYAPLRDAMLRLGPGVRLAVDDVGAGVANFNHLVELRPDFIKIDAGLVRGVDTDSGRRAAVVGLIHFAAEAGCQVIAEGIETEAERATVAQLGVTLGQGYLLAKPEPAGTWSTAAQPPPAPIRAIKLHKRTAIA